MAEVLKEVIERFPYYLACDPGKATGWSTWDEHGVWLDMGTVWSHDELHDFLAGLPITIKVVIVEDFKLFRNKALKQTGSRMPASLSIGQIDTFAKLWGATLVKQPSGVKPIAEKLTGHFTKDPKTGRELMPHSRTHVIDAFNIGEYWLVHNGIKQVKL